MKILVRGILGLLLISSCSTNALLSNVESSSIINSNDLSSINTESSIATSNSSTESISVNSSQSSQSEIEFVSFRLRGDNIVNYSNHALWIWEDGAEGKLYVFQDVDSYGGYIQLPITTWTTRTKLNYIIRPANTWAGQSADTTIFFADFIDYVTQGIMNVYLILGEAEYYFTQADATGDRITGAFFTAWNLIQIQTNAPYTSVEVLANDEVIYTGGAGQSGSLLNLSSSIDIALLYRLKVKFKSTDTKYKYRTVLPTRLFDSNKFNQDYTYTGNDLGLTLTDEVALFKLWAPTSYKVLLNIYPDGNNSLITGLAISDFPIGLYTMVRGDYGVYTFTLPLSAHSGLLGKYYTYTVSNAVGTNEVMDPYANSAGVNGVRAMILDLSSTNPEGWDEVTLPDITTPNELVVYELHVRDLTMDATWQGQEKHRGKYLGLIEEGTTYTQSGVTVSTGFDHLLELGFNALQLLPINDQANNELSQSFNWGYNPLNFNVLEGQYSTLPQFAQMRIYEFKQVVQKFAEHDIRIIMDVVYNHTSTGSGSNFNMIVPGYYYRLNADGTFSDGAGVGNELKSERPMFRKFIIDSVKFWATEYKIKGFRFDLMALIDVTTMNLVKSELAKIDEDIVVYGEPWKGFSDTTLPLDEQSNTYSVYNRLNGIGGFNDAGRNGIRGENTFGNGNEYGWIAKGEADNFNNVTFINRTKGMLAGINGDAYNSSYRDPLKTINYASVHDNLTLYDQLQGTVGVNDAPKASVAVNALVTFSIGTVFLHAGEEIMRTKIAGPQDDPDTYYLINGKNISHNSYKSPDSTNSFKWNLKITYYAQFQNYQRMIALRLAIPSFTVNDANAVALQGRTQGQMGFWDGPLAYSTIAAWYTKDPNNIYYVFANARQSLSSGPLTSQVIWGNTSDQVEILFDSLNDYPVGTKLNGFVLLKPFQVLLVKR